MFKYSLKGLLYWLSVWMITASVLTALTNATLGLFFSTVWFAGTEVVGRKFGGPIGFAYASLIGISLVASALFLMEFRWVPANPRYDDLITKSILVGLLLGTVVWLVVAVADRIYRWFVGPQSA